MRVVTLADGSKFIRLIDRSAVHAAEQMRVDFVANASHELRTPLATIVGYAETLREADGDIDAPTRARFAAIIHDEAKRMQRVVEDLISLSRIEAERFSPPSERLPLTPLVELAVEGHRRIADERGSAIRVDAGPDLPMVAGDRSQLLQVFENIVANALRYGRVGTPVEVTLRKDGRFVHVSVTDHGDGIPAELIPRLTERFFRVDAGRSRAHWAAPGWGWRSSSILSSGTAGGSRSRAAWASALPSACCSRSGASHKNVIELSRNLPARLLPVHRLAEGGHLEDHLERRGIGRDHAGRVPGQQRQQR